MEVLFPRTLSEMQEMRSAMPEGLIMAGGTDLLVQLRKSGQKPPALFCTEQLNEVRNIEVFPEELKVGAAVTLHCLLENETVREKLPVLYQALLSMASPPVRHAATLCGNVCTASPAGDTLPALYVLEAEVELQGRAGVRKLPIGEFINGPGNTALQPEEMLTNIIIPFPGVDTFSSYHKVGKRQAMAISVASLAVALRMDSGKTVRHIRLAWGSVGPTVSKVPAVEEFLTGRRLSVETLREAGRLASSGVSPIDDFRAHASYRRQVSGNLLLRLLEPSFGNGS